MPLFLFFTISKQKINSIRLHNNDANTLSLDYLIFFPVELARICTLTNPKTSDQSNVMSLVEISVD